MYKNNAPHWPKKNFSKQTIVRSPTVGAQKFVWIHFICIYNFLIQIWKSKWKLDASKLSISPSRCSICHKLSYERIPTASVWLVYSLCHSTKERSLNVSVYNLWNYFMQIWFSIVYSFCLFLFHSFDNFLVNKNWTFFLLSYIDRYAKTTKT